MNNSFSGRLVPNRMITYRISILIAFVIVILVLLSAPSISVANSSESVTAVGMGVPNLPGMHAASKVNLPTLQSAIPLAPNKETELNFSEAGYSAWEPNTAVSIGHIYGGVTTFVVPQGICEGLGNNSHDTSIAEWYDQFSGIYAYAGVFMYCPAGSAGSAPRDYLLDWTGAYGSVNPGDHILAAVYAYNSTSIQDYVEDLTTGAYTNHTKNTGSQLPWTDASSVVFVYKACPTTTTGICPQVKYSPIEFGTIYTAVYCEDSNGQLTAAPCYFLGGLGGHNVDKYKAYPIGHHAQGDEMYMLKDLMTEGDSSSSSLFAKTGSLSYGAYFVVKFMKP